MATIFKMGDPIGKFGDGRGEKGKKPPPNPLRKRGL